MIILKTKGISEVCWINHFGLVIDFSIAQFYYNCRLSARISSVNWKIFTGRRSSQATKSITRNIC